MLDLLFFTGTVFMGFFAIMNPVYNISIFLTLTGNEDEYTSRKIAFKSVICAFIIICVFSIAGHYILKLFGISFTALRLAGGVIVALIGYDMLQGNQSNLLKPSPSTIQKTMEEKVTMAFTPLATPLLAGPGVIITAMNFASNGIDDLIITIISFGILCWITYYCFISGKKIQKVLGTSVLKVITRMMGLILTVIGVQMLLQGIYGAIKDFA